MPIAVDIDSLCVPPTIGAGNVCITLPGGAELCAHVPSIVPTGVDDLLRQLFATVNAAMAPLAPIFNVVDVVTTVIDCLKAVATLDPAEIAACIPNLGAALDKLLTIVPYYAVPRMAVDIIDALILFIESTVAQVESLIAYLDRIAASATAAAQPGNFGLAVIVDCANDDLSATIQNFNDSTAPLNRFIGILNYFLCLIGVGRVIPTLGTLLTAALGPGLDALRKLVELLTYVRSLIPIPTVSIPLADQEC